MGSKWTSRKFWLSIIALVYTVVATLGYEIPISQVLVVDAVVAVWVFAEAFVDAARK